MRRLGVWWVVLAIPLAGLAFLPGGGPGEPGAAVAQTTMTFENVPPESAAALEERAAAGRTSRLRVTVSTDEDVDTMVVTEQVVRSGDMTRMGDDIHIKQNEVVHGDVVTVMGGDVVVDGAVHGDVVAVMGGDIYLNATARVDGDVVCIGGELHEESGAFVSGKRVTSSGGGLRVGPRFWEGRDWEDRSGARGLWNGLRVLNAVFRFLIAIGLTLLVAWLFRGRIVSGVETMKRQPGMSFGVGALVVLTIFPSAIALAVVTVLLVITLIGIPLVVVAAVGYALFYLVFALFGLTIGAAVVGEWVASRRGGARLAVWQYALIGVLLLGGVRFLGRIFEVVDVFGFHALGVLLAVLAVSVAAILGLMGGGAWLKWEFSEGMFGRWWGRWQGRNGRVVPAAAPAGPPPAVPPTVPGPGPEPPSGTDTPADPGATPGT